MDKVSKKTMAGRIAAIVCAAVLAVVLGAGVFMLDRGNRAGRLAVENIYQENLFAFSESLSNIEVNMSKLLISNNNTETAVLLNDTYHHSQNASRALGILPMEPTEMHLADRFLNQLGDWCNSQARVIMAQNGAPAGGGEAVVAAISGGKADIFGENVQKGSSTDMPDTDTDMDMPDMDMDMNMDSDNPEKDKQEADGARAADDGQNAVPQFSTFDEVCEELYNRTLKLNTAVKDAVQKLDGNYRISTHLSDGFFTGFNAGGMGGTGGTGGTGGSGEGDTNQNNEYNMPQLIYDGPFSDGQNKKSFKCLDGKDEISDTDAIAKAQQIFADLGFRSARVVGESMTPPAYMLAGSTNNSEMYVSISKQGGMVISASIPCDNTGKKSRIGEDKSKELAVEYAKMCGYDNLSPVWYTQAAGYAVVNLTPMIDGIVFYPDLVKVKICLVTGDFAGIEAFGYCASCHKRDLSPALSAAQAQQAVSDKLTITSSRLALIPKNMKEVLCYEFAAQYKGMDYFVYIDAITGNQANIMRVMDGEQGKIVM